MFRVSNRSSSSFGAKKCHTLSECLNHSLVVESVLKFVLKLVLKCVTLTPNGGMKMRGREEKTRFTEETKNEGEKKH